MRSYDAKINFFFGCWRLEGVCVGVGGGGGEGGRPTDPYMLMKPGT